VSPSVHSLSPATVRQASYPQPLSCFTATALQTKAAESCCVCVYVCVCRWRGAKLKDEAKAKRREECSTKGACVLQLGLCVYVCVSLWTGLSVYVTGLPKLLHVKDAPK